MTKIAGSGSRIRIRIRIRIHESEAWIQGSGSTPKCHGSATLFLRPMLPQLLTGSTVTGSRTMSSSRVRISVADPGCLSRIPDPDFYPSRIPDLGSRIQKQQQMTGVKIFFCQTNFCSHKFHKTEYFYIFDKLNKKN